MQPGRKYGGLRSAGCGFLFQSAILVPVGGAILAILFIAQGLLFIDANSQTFDEATHLTAGYSYLATGDFRLNVEHPPLVKQLCALPVFCWYRLPFRPRPEDWQAALDQGDRPQWEISRDFLYGSSVPADAVLNLARIPNLLLGVLLVLLIGWWARKLWGPGSALLSMTLAAFDPNLIAHSSLVTTDTGVALATLLVVYLVWEYLVQPSARLLVLIGVAFGLALVTKFSAVLLVPILGLVIGSHLLSGGSFALPGTAAQPGQLGARVRHAIVPLLRIVGIGLLMVWIAYGFQGFAHWTTGLRTQIKMGSVAHPGFLFGQNSESGWWYYFPMAFAMKTPVATQFLILAALLTWRRGMPLGRREAVCLLVPAVVLLAFLMRSRLNLGIRYALPVYPFLFILAGRLATLTFRPRWLLAVLVGLPLAWTAFSSMRNSPWHLAYFNELVGGPGEGWRCLGDSNLDWGQGLRGLRAYMDREQLPAVYLSYFGTAPPAALGIRSQYLLGYGHLELPEESPLPDTVPREIVAIGATNLQGIHLHDKELYAWLRHRQPIGTIGHALFLYDVTGDAEAHRQLAEIYRRMGMVRLETIERQKVMEAARTSAAER